MSGPTELDATVANEILKKVYAPRIREAVPTKTLLLNRLRRNTEDVVGLNLNISVHEAFSEALAYTNGQVFPQPQANQYDQLQYQLQRLYAQIQIDGKVIFDMKNNLGSYIRAVDAEVKGMTTSLKIAANEEMFMGAGGVRAIVSSVAHAAGVTTVTVVTAADTAWPYEPSVRYIRPNMVIGFVSDTDEDTDTPTLISSGEATPKYAARVTGVDRVNNTFTITGDWQTATNVAAGDFIIRAMFTANAVDGNYDCTAGPKGSGTGANMQKQPYGLFDIVSNVDLDDTTLALFFGASDTRAHIGGVESAGKSFWQSYVNDLGAGGADYNEMDVETMLNFIEENSTGSPNIMITSYGVLRAAKAFYLSDRHINVPIKTIDGWARAIVHSGIPLVADRHCQSNTLYALDEEHLMIGESNSGQWRDIKGQILMPRETSDAWYAIWFWFHELLTDMRHVHGKIQRINEG